MADKPEEPSEAPPEPEPAPAPPPEPEVSPPTVLLDTVHDPALGDEAAEIEDQGEPWGDNFA